MQAAVYYSVYLCKNKGLKPQCTNITIILPQISKTAMCKLTEGAGLLIESISQ